MRRTIQNAISMLLAAAIVSVLTVSAIAKSGQSNPSGRAGKEASSAAGGVFSSITPAQAEEIALGHAGVDSAAVVFTKDKLDKAVYKLKFSSPEAEYEYEISAAGGSILRCKVETKESRNGPAASAWDTALSYEAAVSPEDARRIALEAAGLGVESPAHVTCYVSWAEHAPYAYEVKFSTRAGYYHYTVDLNSGALLGGSVRPHT